VVFVSVSNPMKAPTNLKNLRFAFGALSLFFLVWVFLLDLADFSDWRVAAGLMLSALVLCLVCFLVWRRLCRKVAEVEANQSNKASVSYIYTDNRVNNRPRQ